MASEYIKKRRDAKGRLLHNGESVRANGKYQFKYQVNGQPQFIYSWRLTPSDPQVPGKKPCLSLREMEKQIGKDMDSQVNILERKITVSELVARYLATKTGVKHNTLMNYGFVKNILRKEEFGSLQVRKVKTSDAKLFLIKLQQQDGRGYSTVKTVRGVLRPAFQMAMDDDIILKNPFGFELAGILVNDSQKRVAITEEQMNQFLQFIKEDNVYCKYYETFYILFHTGLRISEFCGLTIKDIDLENNIINIDHQLQRTSKMEYVIESTKTNAGTRRLPITSEVADCFRRILADRVPPENEQFIDGHIGFLFYDKNGRPEVAMHWEHRFKHALNRYNRIYRIQMPKITPHVCRHTYCSNMAKSGISPKTLQYLMGHSDIGVTLNTYTHLGLEDAQNEMVRLEELNAARAELNKTTGEKPVTQKMFRAV